MEHGLEHDKAEVLVFEHADLGYGKHRVLTDLNLTLYQGDFLGIVGPNGVGKTTILKAMLGILKPLSGRVWRSGSVRFAYVPQRQFIDEVFPLTAMDVALMGRYSLLGAIGRPSRRDREFVLKCLGRAGIVDLASWPYRELSGGQKQRALIARALAAEPRVLVLDEPTNDMDIGAEYAVLELLKRLHDENRITIAMVSHLLNVVANYAQRLALIDGGLRVVGTTAEVLSSKNLSEVYEAPIQVAEHSGRKVVVTGGNDG